jgi:hypothetical protein
MVEIGEFKMVAPTFSMDGLIHENKLLKKQKSALTILVVGAAGVSVLLLLCYLKAKKDAKQYQVQPCKKTT